MKLPLLNLLLFLFFTGQVNAQHCPWDIGRIMILDVHSATDTSIIPNLKITIIDGYGNPVFEGNNFIGDTLKFVQNPPVTYDTTNNESKLPPDIYWFVKDKYIHVTGNLAELLRHPKIKIEDTDGEKNGGYYKTQVIDIHKSDFHELCVSNRNWIKNFKPVQVVLEKTNK